MNAMIIAVIIIILLLSSSAGYYFYTPSEPVDAVKEKQVDEDKKEKPVEETPGGSNVQGGGAASTSSTTGGSGSLAATPAPAVAPQATAWRCVEGETAPLRKNANGDVECASLDETNCIRTAPCAQTLANLPANIKPLTCGDMHKQKYGKTGYDTPGHWCNKYV